MPIREYTQEEASEEKIGGFTIEQIILNGLNIYCRKQITVGFARDIFNVYTHVIVSHKNDAQRSIGGFVLLEDETPHGRERREFYLHLICHADPITHLLRSRTDKAPDPRGGQLLRYLTTTFSVNHNVHKIKLTALRTVITLYHYFGWRFKHEREKEKPDITSAVNDFKQYIKKGQKKGIKLRKDPSQYLELLFELWGSPKQWDKQRQPNTQLGSMFRGMGLDRGTKSLPPKKIKSRARSGIQLSPIECGGDIEWVKKGRASWFRLRSLLEDNSFSDAQTTHGDPIRSSRRARLGEEGCDYADIADPPLYNADLADKLSNECQDELRENYALDTHDGYHMVYIVPEPAARPKKSKKPAGSKHAAAMRARKKSKKKSESSKKKSESSKKKSTKSKKKSAKSKKKSKSSKSSKSSRKSQRKYQSKSRRIPQPAAAVPPAPPRG